MRRLLPLWECLIGPSCRLLIVTGVAALILAGCAGQQPASQASLSQKWKEAGGHYFDEFPERGTALLSVWVEPESEDAPLFRVIVEPGSEYYDPFILVDGEYLDSGYCTELEPRADRSKLDPRLIGLLPGKHTVEVQDCKVTAQGEVWGKPVRLEMTLRPLDCYIVFVGRNKDRSAREVTWVPKPREQMWGPFPPGMKVPTPEETLAEVAGKGSAPALYEMGYRHLCGIGVPVDAKRGEEELALSALQGYAPALKKSGDLYRARGDYRGAINIYIEATNAGYAPAAEAGLRCLDDVQDKTLAAELRAKAPVKQWKSMPPAPKGILQSEFSKMLQQRSAAGRPQP